jgi:hypothetical protein
MTPWAVAAEVAVSGYHTDPPELVVVLSGQAPQRQALHHNDGRRHWRRPYFQPVTDSRYQPSRVPSTAAPLTGVCRCGLW